MLLLSSSIGELPVWLLPRGPLDEEVVVDRLGFTLRQAGPSSVRMKTSYMPVMRTFASGKGRKAFTVALIACQGRPAGGDQDL